MRNRNKTGGKIILAAFVALFVLSGLIAIQSDVSAAPGLLPDMRGNWQGTFVAGGMPVATPSGISMNVTSQGIGAFSGTFTFPSYPAGTLSGSVTTNGSVSFAGDSANMDLSNGRAKFLDYGDGAAILDGTVTITSTNPFFTGPRKIREIRPFANEGNCPCTPDVGDYVGTWGNSGSGGPIKFTVQAADHAVPTKFTSYLYITVAGQQHGFGLIGTGNGGGDIVAIAYGTTARVILTAVLTDPPFLLPRLNGTFKLELNNGTVINEHFSVTKQ